MSSCRHKSGLFSESMLCGDDEDSVDSVVVESDEVFKKWSATLLAQFNIVVVQSSNIDWISRVLSVNPLRQSCWSIFNCCFLFKDTGGGGGGILSDRSVSVSIDPFTN